MTNTNLDGANLKNADLDNIEFIAVIATDVVFENARFHYAKLAQTDFKGSDFTHAVFSGTDLSGAIMTDTRLFNAVLTEVKLYQADLRRANLTRANFRYTPINNVDFDGAFVYVAKKKRVIANCPCCTPDKALLMVLAGDLTRPVSTHVWDAIDQHPEIVDVLQALEPTGVDIRTTLPWLFQD